MILSLLAWLRARSAARAFRRATAARVAAGIALGAAAAIALSCHPHSEQALWRSDGTAEGTEAIFTFPERMPGVWSGPAVVGEELFFLLDDGDWDDGDSHVELWKSDGTAEGTALVTILPTAVGEGGSHEAVGVGGTFYFVYQELEHGIELWKSDGTAEGTGIVRDLVPGEEGSLPSRLWRVGDRLVFFAGYARTYGFALWSTDGTAEGTVLLEDGTNPCQGSTVVDGQLYFLAHDALWQSDGTPAGTRRIGGLRLTGDALLTGIGADVYVAADGQLFAFDRARWRAGSATPIRLVASLPVFAPRSDRRRRRVGVCPRVGRRPGPLGPAAVGAVAQRRHRPRHVPVAVLGLSNPVWRRRPHRRGPASLLRQREPGDGNGALEDRRHA